MPIGTLESFLAGCATRITVDPAAWRAAWERVALAEVGATPAPVNGRLSVIDATPPHNVVALIRPTLDNLVTELRALRRGRGVRTPVLDERVGPTLLLTCNLDRGQLSPVAFREQLVAFLTTASESLPEDLRLTFRGVLGMKPEISAPGVDGRFDQLARYADRDPRTVRRRWDDAAVLVAQQLLHDHLAGAQDGSRQTSTAS